MSYSVYYVAMRRTATALELDWALVDDTSLPSPTVSQYLATGTVTRTALDADDADAGAITTTVTAILDLAWAAAKVAKAALLVGNSLVTNLEDSNSVP